MDYSLLSRSYPAIQEIPRIIRFGCVGLSGVVVNMLLLWFLTERVGLYYLVASAIATEAAILSKFTLNHWWTFAPLREGSSALRKLAKFNLVSLGGLVFSLAI